MMTEDVDNSEQEDEQATNFNPVDAYTQAMERLDGLIKDGVKEHRETYQEAMNETIEAYYSFLDAQRSIDRLAKARAYIIKQHEESMAQAQGIFEEVTEKTTEVLDNVLKPSVWNSGYNNEDSDDDKEI